MRRRLLIPLAVGLSFFLLYCLDRAYYSEKVQFLCPVQYEGEDIPIRCDSFGEGHFGATRKNGRSHKGIDISSPIGTPVVAAKSGWAVAGERPGGYGRYVKIAHSGGLVTLYAHLNEVNIRLIRKVRQGDVIGTVGKTGNASYRSIRPHLHFEVYKNGNIVDPMEYLNEGDIKRP